MRTLQEKDREEILRYVRKEPEMNLFLIGDLENYGVESQTVNFYLHEEEERWDFLILRFHQFFILYSQYEDYNAEEAIDFLRRQKPDCISGKKALLEKVAAGFPQWKIESTYMSRFDFPEGGAEICRDGHMVSVASTSAENSESAMVAGVATISEYRRKGYASAVIQALCLNCFRRGKKYLCLFYDNPAAGRIYNRIGFKELGEYGMLR